MQDFGNAVSHPNSRSYAAFVQNTFQMTRNLTLNLGLRYDLQTFQPVNCRAIHSTLRRERCLPT